MRRALYETLRFVYRNDDVFSSAFPALAAPATGPSELSIPADHPQTAEKIALGDKLFNDSGSASTARLTVQPVIKKRWLLPTSCRFRGDYKLKGTRNARRVNAAYMQTQSGMGVSLRSRNIGHNLATMRRRRPSRTVGLEASPDGRFGEATGQFDDDPTAPTSWPRIRPLPPRRRAANHNFAESAYYHGRRAQGRVRLRAHYDKPGADHFARKGSRSEWQDGFGAATAADPPTTPISSAWSLRRRHGRRRQGRSRRPPPGRRVRRRHVWQRLLSLLGYLDKAFPDGFDGPGGKCRRHRRQSPRLNLRRRPSPPIRSPRCERSPMATLDSPSLATAGGAVPTARVLAYRRPLSTVTDRQFPVAYF